MKSLQSILKDHTLSTALVDAESQVKLSSIDADKRAYWTQLLLLYGDWSRAQAQLKAWEALAPIAQPTTQQLYEAVVAEIQREKVFNGQAMPCFLTQEYEWLSTLASALHSTPKESTELRNLAYQQAKESAGKIIVSGPEEQEQSDNFLWLADADSRLGPVCELFIDDQYYWVPFQDIESITFQQPMNIVHLVWRHSLVKWRSGKQQVCQIPARYPITEETTDSHKLGHRTDWYSLNNDEHYAGQGQKSWLTDNQEYPLLTLNQIQFILDEE